MRTPTENQYRWLLTLGNGCMVISGLHGRTMRQCLHHGWIAPEKPGDDNGFRITPDGVRALARAVDAFGLPEIGRRVERPDSPRTQQLREARDKARKERDDAQHHVRRLRVVVAEVRRALERTEA